MKERLAALSGKAGDLDDVRAIMNTLKEVRLIRQHCKQC